MKKLFQKFKRGEEGAVAIEFAFFAPIIIASVGFMTMYGLATYDKMRLTAGARSIMQYVLIGGTDEATMDAIMYKSSGFDADITISTYCSCSQSRSSAVSCDAETPCGEDTMNTYNRVTASTTRNFFLKDWEISTDIDFRSS